MESYVSFPNTETTVSRSGNSFPHISQHIQIRRESIDIIGFQEVRSTCPDAPQENQLDQISALLPEYK